MNRHNNLGELKFPAFLTLWSAGLVLCVSFLHPADAALLREGPALVKFPELAEVPSFTFAEQWGEDLESALQYSDVAGGRWQPEAPAPLPSEGVDARQAPRIAPVLEVQQPSLVQRPSLVKQPALVKQPSSVKQPSLVKQSSFVKQPSVAEAAHRVGSADAETDKPDNVSWPAGSSDQDDPVDSSTMSVVKTEAETRYFAPLQSQRLINVKQRARAELAEGSYSLAYRMLIEELPSSPADAELLGLLAVAALSGGRVGEAYVIYEKLVELDGSNHRWWAGLAFCQEQLGLDASAVYEAVLKLSADDAPLRALALERLQGVG